MPDYSMDYQEIEKTITDIKAKTADIDSILAQLANVINTTREAWSGTDAEEYMNKINEYRPQIGKLRNYYLTAMKVLENDEMSMMDTQKQVERNAVNDLYFN